MNLDNIFVRYVSMPLSVKGITTPNPDGSFSVYVNLNLSPEMQRETYNHELCHIKHDHLYNFDPVRVNEAQANGKGALPCARPDPGNSGTAPPAKGSRKPPKIPSPLDEPMSRRSPCYAESSQRYGYVRHGKDILIWELLKDGQESETVGPTDRLCMFVRVPKGPKNIDIWK